MNIMHEYHEKISFGLQDVDDNFFDKFPLPV